MKINQYPMAACKNQSESILYSTTLLFIYIENGKMSLWLYSPCSHIYIYIYIYTVSLLYALTGGSACRQSPCDLHCISPLISLWRPYPTSVFTRAAVWLVFQASSHVNKIKKCLVVLAVSSKCLCIHYNKEYSCTIRTLLHHLVGKL